jgi:Family of unknown function (DUF5681)
VADRRKIRLTPPSPESSNYGVGYGKPPAASRFTPGQSGNPKGRPKGARNKRPGPHEERLKEIILEEAYRGVKMNDGKRQITVPLLKAVVRSLGVNAARGQLRSQQAFTKLVFETERDRKAQADQTLEAAIQYKFKWEGELERRKRLGVKGREPLPHPDDVHIDPNTGNVSITGPTNKEEKAEWDAMRQRLEGFDREIEYMTAELKRRRSRSLRSALEAGIAQDRKTREIIVQIVGEPSERRRK